MSSFNNISKSVPPVFYTTKERRESHAEVVSVKRENLSRALRRNFDRINRREKSGRV